MTQEKPIFRAVGLGGMGHVGGNLFVYETPKDVIAVDCGILFADEGFPGIDKLIPDIGYLLENQDRFRGYAITHGHEDHIGALPHVLGKLPGPIYGTRFTLGLLRAKFSEYPHLNPDLRLIKDHEIFHMGDMAIEPLPITHSIPDAVSFAIDTPLGKVIHTGDFKLDPTPLDDRYSALTRLKELGDEGILALISDSTNAGRPGETWSEREVRKTIMELVRGCEDRVFVGTFASNIHRIQGVIDAAEATGRKVIPFGRSMDRYIQVAKECHLLYIKPGTLKSTRSYHQLARNQVIVLATGCQGEPRAALSRMASRQERHIIPDPGDMMIMSARRIPGNEMAVSNLVDGLLRLGLDVIDDRNARVHTSGHAFNGELQTVLEHTKPTFFIPAHGTLRLMMNHAKMAKQFGFPLQDIFVVEDGLPIDFSGDSKEPEARLAKEVCAGLVCVDGTGVGDIDEDVLEDRQLLASHGIVVCVATVDKQGIVQGTPLITTKGVVREDDLPEILKGASRVAAKALESLYGNKPNTDTQTIEIRDALRRFFKARLGRKPLTLAVVNQISV